MNFKQGIALMSSLLAFGLGAEAGAVCVQTGASQADRDLWNTHGCWQDFYLWQYRAYGLRGGDWSNRGWSDACNVSLEFPKHWNASYLLTYGMEDNYAQSFHGTADYRGTAEAPNSNFHDSLYHSVSDRTDILGSFSPRFWPWDTDKVETACPVYNPNAISSDPASRAGDYMHEGWHANFDKYNINNGNTGGHRPGPQGSCTVNGCDYFYFHGISKYAFGAMWENNGTASRFHSPNQVQVEFLCDVADQSQWWIPLSVRQTAAANANSRAVSRFINGPGYSCGSPRPW
ncbi:hypothetical protein [Corallococcus terminator]|uniref:Uncharacterized protein n=1 Tax=Corallococcus terminator TaxID=2316733 RepID=A0A3A8I7B0_9BACT|nr:hypothetical protein [Corallococcus terminator]RKG75704.1 hypothetical protein D7V88_33160 [Corallococcus terminator]